MTGRTTTPGLGDVVTEAEVAGLPDVVQRYLRFMGAVGRPRDKSFVARFTGRFRLGPGKPWMRCHAWQYDTADPVARVFHMRLDFARVVPMIGNDTYLRGRGRMHGRLLGLVTVADGSGPEYDVSELVTYVNDCVLLAPSMLLCPATRWAAAGDDAFDVTFTDSGLTVTARVFVDGAGRPVDFSTEDRWAALPGGPVRARWTTPVAGWGEIGGRPVATGGAAVWHLPEGEFRYGEGRFSDVEWDVLPPRSSRRQGARRSRRPAGWALGAGRRG